MRNCETVFLKLSVCVPQPHTSQSILQSEKFCESVQISQMVKALFHRATRNRRVSEAFGPSKKRDRRIDRHAEIDTQQSQNSNNSNNKGQRHEVRAKGKRRIQHKGEWSDWHGAARKVETISTRAKASKRSLRTWHTQTDKKSQTETDWRRHE